MGDIDAESLIRVNDRDLYGSCRVYYFQVSPTTSNGRFISNTLSPDGARGDFKDVLSNGGVMTKVFTTYPSENNDSLSRRRQNSSDTTRSSFKERIIAWEDSRGSPSLEELQERMCDEIARVMIDDRQSVMLFYHANPTPNMLPNNLVKNFVTSRYGAFCCDDVNWVGNMIVVVRQGI